MGEKSVQLKLLFIVNPGSGNGEINFGDAISAYFEPLVHTAEIYELPLNCSFEKLKEIIAGSNADRVIAVGGDGTVKLIAECLLQTNTPMGIIPAGSANGMAKELGIPTTIKESLDVTVNGQPKKIHVITVNGELCIHLADIGFNAYLVKKFNDLPQRGMWGYTKAAWKALWSHHKMEVLIKVKDKTIRSEAAMVVIANATMYGTGVKINPDGKLDDDFFEVILVKEYSVMEILKLRFTNMALNPKNIESFQTTSLNIKTKHKAHFQVDGEYMGKVSRIEANIVPAAISVIV
jgi:YegS/Rv2252/BmrU family lipid kinase